MDNFIFVMGCGHSGTTIINKIIGNHKDIYGVENETSLFFSECSEKIEKQLAVLSNARYADNKKWVCEKTPRHVYKITEIYKHVKSPKIIIMVRDGRDVVASLLHRYGLLYKSVGRWVNDNYEWMNHKNVADFCVVKYEDFVADPRCVIKTICDYIGITYYDDILNYSKCSTNIPNFSLKIIDGSDHSNLRKYQINQNIYDGSKRYLRDLSQKQLDQLYEYPNFVMFMNKFGYIN